MKSVPFVLAALASAALANTAPTVVIQTATMRPGTTLMDVVYRVNDPDDATVKTRALAFVDGVRSFAKVIRPVTFAEGTAAKLGDAIPSNINHTLTWDVGADWDVDLGQVKFEVLAMDGRGLLPFDWITIPAAGGEPELTISKNSPTDAEVLNALFWQYADGDSGLTLTGGVLSGNASSGVFDQVVLANGNTLQAYSTPFVFKRMNLDPDDGVFADSARAALTNPQGWHAARRSYTGVGIVLAWGGNSSGQTTLPTILSGVTAIAAGGYHSLALKSNGTVIGWGSNVFGQRTIPAGLSGVTAIAAGNTHSLALKGDGTVVGWGNNTVGAANIPAGLSDVIAIAARSNYNLALKSDGTVVGWGNNDFGQTIIPAGLTDVIAIAAGDYHSLALKSDGSVIAWGLNTSGQSTPPSGLRGVTAIAAGASYSLALKSDGTVVGWGGNNYGAANIPAGLSDVIAIAAGTSHSLALKSDGTVVGWGSASSGQANIPAGLTDVIAIAGSHQGLNLGFVLAIKAKAP
jgi:hypothetical protein